MIPKIPPSLILTANLSIFILLYWILFNYQLDIFSRVGIFFLIAICQHYFLNIVHIASHKIAHKNTLINNLIGITSSVFGGVTFADFQTTHMLHHASTSHPHKDPDYFITTFGPIFLIPFKIFHHDYYFWKNKLYQKNRWIDYLLVRVIQVAIVLWFYSKNLNIWLHFWLLPLFLVGTLNGFFLFYFPHYTTKYEKKLRKKSSPNIFEKSILTSIDISRTYHEDHHQNVQTYDKYFPVVGFFVDQLRSKPIRKYPNNLKYTDL